MEKAGLSEHRYSLFILNLLYVFWIVPLSFMIISRDLYLFPFIAGSLCVLIGLLGFFILWREDDVLMNCYRKLLIGVIGLQVLAYYGVLIILLFRTYTAETFLRHLMENYIIDKSIQDTMDTIQLNFECCGVDSYKDWDGSLPSSCCGKSILNCNHSLTKFLGCKENLSMFLLLISLAFLFLSTGNIILHAYCTRCAFELTKGYQRAKNES